MWPEQIHFKVKLQDTTFLESEWRRRKKKKKNKLQLYKKESIMGKTGITLCMEISKVNIKGMEE